MSVSNVNSIYGAQMGSNAGYDTPAIKIEEKESNIGAWLCGGLALVATLGVGIAGYKSGKTLKEGDGVLTTVWNGIKSWFGKNGDDVAKNIDDIPAECKTSFKTFFSGGKITSEQKQDIVDNADEISKVFLNKAGKNASKATSLETIKTKKDEDKLKALAEFLGVKGELKFKDSTAKTLDFSALSADDQARITRKLKDTNGNSITEKSINDIITALQTKYEAKHKNYDTAVGKIKNIRVSDVEKNSNVFSDTTIAKRLNRAGAAQTLAVSCEDPSSYINTQASLTKWHDAGDLTKDEYDNLKALAEQKFMSQNGDEYLSYLKQILGKANDSKINFDSLNTESIVLLNEKFKGLELTENTKLNINDLLNWKKENTKSISEYLGLSGAQIPSGWTIENNALHFKGSSTPSINIGETKISDFNSYQNMSGGKVTGYTITLDKLRGILNPATRS